MKDCFWLSVLASADSVAEGETMGAVLVVGGLLSTLDIAKEEGNCRCRKRVGTELTDVSSPLLLYEGTRGFQLRKVFVRRIGRLVSTVTDG